MALDIKLKATLENGITTVKTQMFHPMDTGLFKDSLTGAPIPEYFIEEVVCEHNGKPVMSAHWGIAISKNPYLSLSFMGGKPGDAVSIRWRDNKGASASAETTIS